MREYEFRGKLLNTDVWIYGNLRIHLTDGDLTQTEKSYFIEYDYMNKIGQVFRDCYEVEPSTIGQFTELLDYDGNRIYEQDIVEYGCNHTKGVVKFGEFNHSKCSEHSCNHYGYYIEVDEPNFKCKLDLSYMIECSSIRVIKQPIDKIN